VHRVQRPRGRRRRRRVPDALGASLDQPGRRQPRPLERRVARPDARMVRLVVGVEREGEGRLQRPVAGADLPDNRSRWQL